MSPKPQPVSQKRPYRRPKLVKYGDATRLTLGMNRGPASDFSFRFTPGCNCGTCGTCA